MTILNETKNSGSSVMILKVWEYLDEMSSIITLKGGLAACVPGRNSQSDEPWIPNHTPLVITVHTVAALPNHVVLHAACILIYNWTIINMSDIGS